MNSLKTALVVVLLGAIGFGVYVAVHRNPESKPPPGVAEGWPSPPQLQLPEPGTSEFPYGSPTGMEPMDPSGGGPDGLATPFSAQRPSDNTLGGSMTTPFPPAGDPNGLGPNGVPPGAGSDSPRPIDGMETAGPPIASSKPAEVRQAFIDFMEEAYNQLNQGNLASVHQTLSLWYDKPQLTPEERRQITDLLDQVAGTVVYSRQHLLEDPYTVKSGDTLKTIARDYGLPWQLLAKINEIPDPEDVHPGQQLKVVRGPFDAEIHLDKHELTLMLGSLYAGRFRIGIGRGQQDLVGTYYVEDKIVQPAGSNDPLGKYIIKLDDQVGIHGTNDPRNIGTAGGPGSILLGDQDLEDVHDILSVGSRVRILR